jgi:hypothetical protein
VDSLRAFFNALTNSDKSKGNKMSEVQNDVNNVQPVTDQGVTQLTTGDGVSQPSTDTSATTDAGVQHQATQVATGALADGTTTDKTIPYERFSEVNAAKKNAEQEVQRLQSYIQGMSTQTQTQPQQENIFVQVAKEKGYDPEGYLSYAEQSEINAEVMNRTTAQNQVQMQTQAFISSKPDYAQVVGQNDPITGQFVAAGPLQRKINQNPAIATALQAAGPNAAVLAYELASTDQQYLAEKAKAQQPPAVQQGQAAQDVLQQASGLTSVSAVSGTGAINKTDTIKGMNAEDFDAYSKKLRGEA